MKVLFGVDGSAGSFAAVRQVARWLSAEGDSIALFYTPLEVKGQSSAEVRERAKQALAKAVFGEALEQLPAELRPAAQTIVGTKPPRQGLLLAADEIRADLIVAGARGLGPIEKLLLGSVSRSLAHDSHVPVLVVREQAERPATALPKVLLAYDGSDGSRRAADLLDKFTWPAGTVGRAITVIESLLAGAVPKWLEEKARDTDSEAMAQAWVHEHEEEKQQTRDQLAEFAQKLPLPFRSSEPIVAEGHAAERILEVVEAQGIDLVVMGSGGKSAWEQWLIGSTSQKVLNAAPCSVLLARDREKP